jgi:hypothetical protein
MKQTILSQAVEILENSYPEGGVTEEVLQEIVQQVVEELYDYGEMEETDYDFFVRSVPRLSEELAASFAEETESDDSTFGADEEE